MEVAKIAKTWFKTHWYFTVLLFMAVGHFWLPRGPTTTDFFCMISYLSGFVLQVNRPIFPLGNDHTSGIQWVPLAQNHRAVTFWCCNSGFADSSQGNSNGQAFLDMFDTKTRHHFEACHCHSILNKFHLIFHWSGPPWPVLKLSRNVPFQARHVQWCTQRGGPEAVWSDGGWTWRWTLIGSTANKTEGAISLKTRKHDWELSIKELEQGEQRELWTTHSL